MNWRDSPRLVEQLAAAYALGTLAGPARRRFETVLQTDLRAARAVADWNRRFAPLGARLPPQPARDALWQQIERRSFGAPEASAPPAAAARRRWSRWLGALLSPLPGAALVTGLMVGALLPTLWPLLHQRGEQTELPESYVGVLATAEGRTGMIVSSRRYGRIVDLKRVSEVALPAGQTLFLWAIDAQGRPTAIGPVPQGSFVRLALAQPAEQIFAKATELGLSIEPLGATPAAPTLPFAYRGLCGKLWRVVAPR